MPVHTATQLLKRELRKRIRSSLSALPPSKIREESSQVTDRFLATDTYKSASSIAIYDSMSSEFDTSYLVLEAFKAHKRVFFPRVVSKDDHVMLMLEVSSCEDVAKCVPNNWGIREPGMAEGRAEAPRDAAIDVIVMPGLAFDAHGARCGQGMGFYDTYLKRYAGSGRLMPRLVALALSVQIVGSVPTTGDDWVIDEVLFPDGATRG